MMPFKRDTNIFGEAKEPTVAPDTLRKLREELAATPPLRAVRKPVKPVLTEVNVPVIKSSTPAISLNTDTSSTPATLLNTGTSRTPAIVEAEIKPEKPPVQTSLPEPARTINKKKVEPSADNSTDETEEEVDQEPVIKNRPRRLSKVGKWAGLFGLAAMGVIGTGSYINNKALPKHERSAAQSELAENRGSIIKVMDQTALAMALMRNDQTAISTKKTISVYYDAPKNLLFSKVGLDKERFSEKMLEFEGQLFYNNRATGEGNIWFGETKILITLDNYEGELPDNKCNIPGVPKAHCMSGMVLFDLTFEKGQISSVAFSTLVGNKNASNADSSANIGTVNAGKRSLDIELTDPDLLSRIKTLYAVYSGIKQVVSTDSADKKDSEVANLMKTDAFQKKLLEGTVVYDFVSSNGNRDSCTGFVYANDVIVTARHCLVSNKTDANGVLLENIMSVSKDKNDVVRQSNIWNRGNGKYQYAFSAYKDLGVIVFDRPSLPRVKPLAISEKPITEKDKFVFGHVVKTEGRKYWRSELGSALAQRDNYDINDPYWLKFGFGLQKGNSGGAAVDINGDVVSVLRNHCDYDEASNNGKFCGDRVTKKDVMTLIEEARKKLSEL